MGFTTGFVCLRHSTTLPWLMLPQSFRSGMLTLWNPQLGGFTLISATLYLTLALHQQNRARQATLLRQQRLVLSNIVDPQPPAPEPRARQVPIGLSEMAKDRWNREVEGAVRWVEEVDWRRVREKMEERVGEVVKKVSDGK